MKAKIKNILKRIIFRGLDLIVDEKLELLILGIIQSRLRVYPPAQGLKFLFDMDAKLYHLQSQLAVDYDGGMHTKHRHMKYHDFFVNRINETDRVLDIGCGIGVVAFDVAVKTGARVLGMDISIKSIKTARDRFQHPNLEFRSGDALETLPDEIFTVVILSNVLEHLPERPFFLRRVQETVQPKRILIRVPTFERDWRVPLKKELGTEWRLDNTH